MTARSVDDKVWLASQFSRPPLSRAALSNYRQKLQDQQHETEHVGGPATGDKAGTPSQTDDVVRTATEGEQ